MTKLPRNILCLDWDARFLRIVVAKLGANQMSLQDAHSHRIPNTVDVESPEALGDFVQQMLRRHHIRHNRAIVSIPREKAVINRLTLPPTPLHEVSSAVRFQAMRELPFPLDDAVLDYVIMQRDERGSATEVLLAAVPREALQFVRATCQAAGLTPARVGLRPYANLTAVRNLSGAIDERVLFVDVGPQMTEIDVIIKGELAFARSANVSVPLPAEAASDESRITRLADVSDLEISDEALEGAVRELSVEITRTLQAYRATDPDAQVDVILVAGGTGLEPALLESVERRFGLRSRLFDPTQALGVSPDDAAKLRSFAAPLGLAWRLGQDRALAIDFENPKKAMAPKALMQQRLRRAGLAAALVFVAVVVGNEYLLQQKRAEIRAKQATASRIRVDVVRNLEIENQVERVKDWWAEALWPEHLLHLTESALVDQGEGKDPKRRMLVQQLTLDARGAKMNLKKVLVEDWQAPTEFVERLNDLQNAEGERVYQARQGSLRTLSGQDSKFEKAVDIEVELRELQKHHETQEEREKARRRKLRDL